MRPDSEHFHGMGVGTLLGFAETVLALDLNVVEAVFEAELHDLGALRLACAVGDQGEPDTLLLKPIERRMRVGEHRQFLVVQGG